MAIDGKALVRRFYEEMENEGRLEVADEICDPGFRDVHNSSARGPVEGIEGIKRLAKVLRDQLNIRITIEDLIAEGDRVVARISSRTTYSGDFMGVPAAGKSFTSQGVEIFRVANGKLVERWVFIDQLPVLRELGIIPKPTAH
ncbi:MAG TPA: ester cyclase [Chloroflexota bacterium]|nr:ester cyclase [Chloroflexota bacterium]